MQVSADTSAHDSITNGKLDTEGLEVTHTFGRLGQSKATGLAGSPVILDKSHADKRAGVQISLFPELTGEVDDWGVTADNQPTISVKALAGSTLIATAPSKSPTVVSDKEVGAQALAASIIAAASIASTLF